MTIISVHHWTFLNFSFPFNALLIKISTEAIIPLIYTRLECILQYLNNFINSKAQWFHRNFIETPLSDPLSLHLTQHFSIILLGQWIEYLNLKFSQPEIWIIAVWCLANNWLTTGRGGENPKIGLWLWIDFRAFNLKRVETRTENR